MPAQELFGIFLFILAVLLFTDWAFNATRLNALRIGLNIVVAAIATAVLDAIIRILS